MINLSLLFNVKKTTPFIPRLEFYNGALFYFSSGSSAITWNEASSACTGLFQSQNGWSGPSANLASFHTKEELKFMW